MTNELAIRIITGDILGTSEQTHEAIKMAVKALSQPEPEKGKWIYGEDKYGIDGYHCDKCGFFVPWDYTHKFINYIEDYKFCPNCGVEMENGNGKTD